MTPWYADDAVTVWHGDCLDILADMADNSVDAVCTDPPYGLEFMGREWDRFGGDVRQPFRGEVQTPDNPYGRSTVRYAGTSGYGGQHNQAMLAYQQWCQTWAEHCLRVLKPGGHLLAFGGTRTHHRLAVAIEDAGFEIRDSIAWLYGSGFPKSLDVSKAIDRAAGAEREVVGYGQPRSAPIYDGGLSVGTADPITAPATDDARRWNGWGTALKPGHEPIVVARKPLAGTVAANVLTWGTGALNIDATRIEGKRTGDPLRFTKSTRPRDRSFGKGGADGDGGMFDPGRPIGVEVSSAGRWPPNVALDPHTAAALDQENGTSVSRASAGRNGADQAAATWGLNRSTDDVRGHDDSGGASRFFPVFRYEPKAPTLERPRAPQEGAAGEVIARTVKQCSTCGSKTIAAGPGGEPACGHGTWTHVDISVSKEYAAHPTVKPLDLMRWLVRLVTPPGGLVLDPFLGSGTTAEACIVEGFRCIGVERETAYLPMIRARLTKPIQPVLDLGEL